MRISIRQGCLLAPSLFFISLDANFYLLGENNLSPKVKGITLLNNTDLLSIQFPDDTALFLELFKGNMELLVASLREFGEASRAKIS